MTLAQIDALVAVENKSNDRGDTGKLPAPSQRHWGTAQDFAQWENRANV